MNWILLVERVNIVHSWLNITVEVAHTLVDILLTIVPQVFTYILTLILILCDAWLLSCRCWFAVSWCEDLMIGQMILFFSLEKTKTKRRHILKEIVDIQCAHNEGRGIDDNEHGFSLLPLISLCGVTLAITQNMGNYVSTKLSIPWHP